MRKSYLKIIVFFICCLITNFSFGQITIPVAASSSSVESIKEPDSKVYTYTVSGLGTVAEGSDLVTLFLSRPGILEATIDLPVHKIKIKVPKEMPESDILEVLKFAGKFVIDDPKLLTKYY